MADNNSLNINSSTPLTPARGGTGVSNGTHTLTVNSNSAINQDVQTSASPTFSNIKVTSVLDTNNNAILSFGYTASAVNSFVMANSATGTSPTLSGGGSDTDVGIQFAGKGTGNFRFISNNTTVPLVLLNGTGAQHATSFVFANTLASRALTFPDADGTVALLDSSSNLSANNVNTGYTTTATAAGTTTLTVASTFQQFFTGSTTQTVVLPVTSTLVLGFSFFIVNNSSGALTIQSSGGNTVATMAAGTFGNVTCILTSGTSAASWSSEISMPSGGGGNGFTSQHVVTGSRSVGSVYQNTTGGSMLVTVTLSGSGSAKANTDSSSSPSTTVSLIFVQASVSFIVLNNNYYSLATNSGSPTVQYWTEWY